MGLHAIAEGYARSGKVGGKGTIGSAPAVPRPTKQHHLKCTTLGAQAGDIVCIIEGLTIG